MDCRPIGILDSGVGGLTVMRAVINRLPQEDIIYFGDTAHVPYGDKSKEELFQYACDMLDFFISKDVKAVVFACNTNSSLTLPRMKQSYDLPMLGVVKAGARAAASTSRNKKIGVIATQNTVNSHAYASYIQMIDCGYEVLENACPALVPMIEAGDINNVAIKGKLTAYIQPLINKSIDTLVMGCTHYPFLIDKIKAVVGEDIKLVDPALETVNELYNLLREKNLLNNRTETGAYQFYVSGNGPDFYKTGNCLLPGFIPKVNEVDLDKRR
jgi:glutamate racemase